MGEFISVFPNQFKALQGLTALKPAADGRYLMCQSLPYYIIYIYCPVIFLRPVNHEGYVIRVT